MRDRGFDTTLDEAITRMTLPRAHAIAQSAYQDQDVRPPMEEIRAALIYMSRLLKEKL